MNKKLKQHYLETGSYTYAGLYKEYFKSLPDISPLVGESDNYYEMEV
ncbi:MAG: hypothetical protein K0S01_3048 [Herbinix sp.]|jgi:hypothetical protein|nr:hypothetical protein [Herbinix sp.]